MTYSSDDGDSSEHSVELLPPPPQKKATTAAEISPVPSEVSEISSSAAASGASLRGGERSRVGTSASSGRGRGPGRDGESGERSSKKRPREGGAGTTAGSPPGNPAAHSADADRGRGDAAAKRRKPPSQGEGRAFAVAPDGGAAAAAAPPPSDGEVPDPIVPRNVPSPSDAAWSVKRGCLLVRSPRRQPKRANPFAASSSSSSSPAAASRRTKMAGFDMDGTLFVWRANWPSRLDQYELWSSTVIPKLRALADEGYLLAVFSNQGGIRSAFGGKRAAKAKALVDWLAREVGRPVCAVMSTDKKGGYHKPDPGMWELCEDECNGGVRVDVSESFYVGDSAGDGTEGSSGDGGDAYQDEGVDRMFAENVSQRRGATLKFLTPDEFFGESDSARRKAATAMAAHEEPPPGALRLRAALSGGYLKGPILLVLCGAQGSGKSTFCSRLCREEDGSKKKEGGRSGWAHLSQDTIRKGKPGTREAVEKAAFAALEAGRSVVIDRMHLDREQRSHFVAVAMEAEVPAHAVVLDPPESVLTSRVRDRTNHPGGVHGAQGARMAAGSAKRMVPPKYEEMFELISRVSTAEAADNLAYSYRRVMLPMEKEERGRAASESTAPAPPRHFVLSYSSDPGAPILKLPSIALGTQKVGKRAAPQVVASALRAGFGAIDTAPTYNNEEEVGHGIAESKSGEESNCFVIAKVPKRATSSRQVREEVTASLERLGISCADLLLLHWPCDLIEIGSLGAVWSELESLRSEGKCRSLGVSNFSVGALRALLPLCRTARPAVNQIERHPLLPQWDVVDFCARQGVAVQAHTALGGGRSELLEHPTVVRAAEEAGTTAAQVLLLWNLGHGVPVAVKAADEGHVSEIAAVRRAQAGLMPEHVEMLDGIGSKEGDVTLKRFVAPPFMYKPGAPYSWGDRPPSKR